MAEKTTIAWAHSSFNPVVGCTEVGPGCENCYAREWAKRNYPAAKWGAGNPRIRTAPSGWQKPALWNRRAAQSGDPHRVFCGSLCDVFDNEWPEDVRRDLFQLIGLTPHLTWLLLTKRIGNVARMIPAMHSNVWLGATICNQKEVRDINKLLEAPAALHFLSLEPLLGPVNIEPWLRPIKTIHPDPFGRDRAIGWVIVGAESGPKRRPFEHVWVRSLAEQCKAAQVPLFVKQDSSLRPGARGKIPDDLWIREIP